SALSLANFTPRIENLPSRCHAVYTTQIQGCQAGDFTTQSGTCSSQCVSGLVTIMQAVETACAGVDVPETSVIGIFLLGLGVQTLCPGIEVVTLNPSSTTSPTSRPTTSPAQTTSATSVQTRTSPTTPTTSSPGGISVDPSVPTTLATSALPPEQSTPPPESPAPNTPGSLQKSNADSGGGSPFDITATGSSVSRSSLQSTMAAAVL
ncbi:uncharacterized protein EI97DRAFT_346404, partial [Westerdykella ornata]